MRNIVVAYFLTDFEYPFFKYTTKPQLMPCIKNWCESVQKVGLDAIVFVDEEANLNHPLTKGYDKIRFEMIASKAGINQMDDRWIHLYRYMESAEDVRAFFMTDIGDATFLKNPFKFIKHDVIYVGDEESKVDIGWMSHRVNEINREDCRSNFELIKEKILLNCGIFGGYRNAVLPALKDISDRLMLYNFKGDVIDMIVTNEVLHLKYSDKIFHGYPLNTEFWRGDIHSDCCYIQHK